MKSPGTAAFVVEDFAPNMPDVDRGKELERNCPLCNEPKKLKDMRGHVGQHILLRSRGAEEYDLVNPVSLPSLWFIPDTNRWYVRSVTIHVDSVVVTCVAPASWLPVPNNGSTRIVGFVISSSMARLKSRPKTPHVPMSQSTAPTARKRFGNTTPLATLCFDTGPSWTVTALTPV